MEFESVKRTEDRVWQEKKKVKLVMFKSGCNYKANLVFFGQQCVQQLRLGFENHQIQFFIGRIQSKLG